MSAGDFALVREHAATLDGPLGDELRALLAAWDAAHPEAPKPRSKARRGRPVDESAIARAEALIRRAVATGDTSRVLVVMPADVSVWEVNAAFKRVAPVSEIGWVRASSTPGRAKSLRELTARGDVVIAEPDAAQRGPA